MSGRRTAMSGYRTLIVSHLEQRSGRMLHVRMNVPPVAPAIEAAAEGLVLLNVWYLQEASDNGVDLPHPYASGVVYRREPRGREWWETANDILSIATDRSGDCEDIASYLAAWLRVYADDMARVAVIRNSRGNFHAVVEHENGDLEDPSKVCVYLERRRAQRTQRAA